MFKKIVAFFALSCMFQEIAKYDYSFVTVIAAFGSIISIVVMMYYIYRFGFESAKHPLVFSTILLWIKERRK